MTSAIFSAIVVLSLAFSLIQYGCSTETPSNSPSDDIHLDTSWSTTRQPNGTNNSGKQINDLTKIYSQAIGDYIRLVDKEYNLTFDTLFFGKRVNGQPDDFPDIELPSFIENTSIQLVSPEQGEKIQMQRKSSFYINLIGWANAVDAEFIFVTFSSGFAHQFDCFMKYKYDTKEKEFVMENTRFENYRYKKK